MDANSINVEVESINKELANLRDRVKNLNARKKKLQADRLKIAQEKEETEFMWQGKKVKVVETVKYTRKPDKAKRADIIGVLTINGFEGDVNTVCDEIISASRNSRTIVEMK